MENNKVMTPAEWRLSKELAPIDAREKLLMEEYAQYYHSAQQPKTAKEVEDAIEREYPIKMYPCQNIDGSPMECDENNLLRDAMRKGYSLKSDVDWDSLRDEYFKDCTIKFEREKCDEIKIAIAPHDLFQWFRSRLSKVVVDRWISVENELPKDGQYVLVCYSDNQDVCKYTMVFKMEFVANSVSMTHCVTHWQPLPPLPTK